MNVFEATKASPESKPNASVDPARPSAIDISVANGDSISGLKAVAFATSVCPVGYDFDVDHRLWARMDRVARQVDAS